MTTSDTRSIDKDCLGLRRIAKDCVGLRRIAYEGAPRVASTQLGWPLHSTVASSQHGWPLSQVTKNYALDVTRVLKEVDILQSQTEAEIALISATAKCDLLWLPWMALDYSGLPWIALDGP